MLLLDADSYIRWNRHWREPTWRSSLSIHNLSAKRRNH